MARITVKSQSIIIDQLTSQVDELRTQVGVLMSALEESNQRAKALQDDIDNAAHDTFTRSEVNELIELEVADRLKSAFSVAPRKPAPVSSVESQPTIEITDFDRAMYRKFQALPREQRLEIIAFARPIVGHVGIHNIVTVRAAWHESQAQVDDAIDEHYQAV